MSNLAEAMEKYLTMGERMGLKGPELKAFLDKQQEVEKTRLNEERDERAAARAKEKEKLDHELALAKAKQEQEIALAKAKQDQEIALAKAKQDQELARAQEQHVLAQEQHALAKAKQDQEIALAKAQSVREKEKLEREFTFAQEQTALARERETREKARQDQEFALARTHDTQEKERREEEFILTRSRVDREQAQLEKEQILALAREEKEHVLTLAREEREQAMVLARMTHEREMRKLDRANAGGGDRDHENDDVDISDTPVSARSSSNKFFGPKIPAFDEVHDCMDSYLQRFERYAEGQKWVPDLWAHYLSALLKGKALDVYGRLSTDQAKDYAFVKDALLKRFKTTFYTSKVEVGESPTQFIARLSNYLTRWIDLSGIDKSYESLKELMIREQYLNISPKDLMLFIRERKPANNALMATLAESFVDSHRVSQVDAAQHKAPFSKKQGSFSKDQKKQDASSKPSTNTSNFKQDGTVKEQRSCYICSKQGHVAKNCYQRNKPPKLGAMTAAKYFPSAPKSTPTSVATGFSCKAHNKLNCADCMNIPSGAQAHSCGAMISTVDNELELKCGCFVPVLNACKGNSRYSQVSNMPVVTGYIGGKPVQVLRDTGCSTVVVRQSLVTSRQLTGETQLCVLIDGTTRKAQCAQIYVDTPFYTRSVRAVCMKEPLYDLIIGSIPGVKNECTVNNTEVFTKSKEEIFEGKTEVDTTAAVQTRAQVEKDKIGLKPLKVLPADEIISRDKLLDEQLKDISLEKFWNMSKTGEIITGRHSTVSCIVKKDLLYRKYESPKHKRGEVFSQVMVPTSLRKTVMKLAHSSVMGGHLGTRKTYDRIFSHFFWSGLTSDVRRFCQSCDICQRTVAKGRTAAVPLGTVPMIETPFHRVAMDLVGPIAPASDRGHRYILVLVDYATRFPEAVALKNIDTVTIAEALMSIFSRVGVPREIQSDQGTQFVSDLMKEVSRLLSIKQLILTPYHAMANGLVEKFNAVLKSMLKKMCAEKVKDWDRYIDALLFAYREVPQESLGYFFPFDLLYGRSVRGPMTILRELWTKEEQLPEVRTTYQYVLDLSEKLEDTCKLARDELSKSSARACKYYNMKTKPRTFKEGDLVLLLLPTDHNKLLMHWRGPFKVVERVNNMDYRVDLGSRIRMLHANLLKRYYPASEVLQDLDKSSSESLMPILGAAVIEAEYDQDGAVDDDD